MIKKNRVLIWRFTLVLIKINYGHIGDQKGLFYTTNPVFYASGNIFVRRTGTIGNLTFSLVPSDNVIQDVLVRRQFSLVPRPFEGFCYIKLPSYGRTY